MINILLLEDDELFALSLIDYLEEFTSFTITHVSSEEQLLNTTYNNKFDLYLFDINIPNSNGIELLKDLKQSGDETPTIFLTSYKDKETLTSAFNNGADDFLTKPFDMDELILRINSIMKRFKKVSTLLLFDCEFNFSLKTVKRNGIDIKVSHKVLELFELFYQHNNTIVTKDMIVNKLWNMDEQYSDGSIRVYVNNIKKIFENSNKFKIQSVKGIGYKIEY